MPAWEGAGLAQVPVITGSIPAATVHPACPLIQPLIAWWLGNVCWPWLESFLPSPSRD